MGVVSGEGLKGGDVSVKGFKGVTRGYQGGVSRGCLKEVSQGGVVSTGCLKGVSSQEGVISRRVLKGSQVGISIVDPMRGSEKGVSYEFHERPYGTPPWDPPRDPPHRTTYGTPHLTIPMDSPLWPPWDPLDFSFRITLLPVIRVLITSNPTD